MGIAVGPRCGSARKLTIRPNRRHVFPNLMNKVPKRPIANVGILGEQDRDPCIFPLSHRHTRVDFIPCVLIVLGMLRLLGVPQGLGFGLGQGTQIAEKDGSLMLLINRRWQNARKIRDLKPIFENIKMDLDPPTAEIHRPSRFVRQFLHRYIGGEDFRLATGQEELDHTQAQYGAHGRQTPGPALA